MNNPQPDHTDLGVYQSVDMENGITLRQCSERTLELIASNGADRTTIHDVERECAKKLITALQRWLDTGGFYEQKAVPLPDGDFILKMKAKFATLELPDFDDE